MKKESITIYDIAKAANVSPTTVSRVLTSKPLVKESTRRLILKKMEELGYTPNEAARSLTNKKTNMIGFILPDITNPFFSQVYIDVERKAMEKGYTVLLRNSMGKSEMESAHLREFTERRVECIVFMGGRINKVKPNLDEVIEMLEVMKNVPILMVNGQMDGVECPIIRTDEEKAIRSIVSYLVSLGHKKIGLIGGIKGVSSTDTKVKVLRQELEKFGLPFHEEWQIYSGYRIDDGKIAMGNLLSRKELPTAIIGINDMIIYGALKKCRESNLSPSNFSFIGYDDIFLSDIVFPSLTTINHNYELLSSTIVHAINSIIEKKSFEHEVVIESKLVIRESCQIGNMAKKRAGVKD